METNEIQQKEITQSMEIDGSIMSVLNETRKWTKFIAILGFIGIAFLVLMGLFFGTFFSSMMESIPQKTTFLATTMSITYIIMAIVFFFPILYLLNFSNKMKIALYYNNQEALYEAFNNLKRYYKFKGILIIIGLLIWGAIIIGASIFAVL